MPTFLIMLETLHGLFKVDQGLIAFAERVPTDGRSAFFSTPMISHLTCSLIYRLEYNQREQCKADAAAAKEKAENDAHEAQKQVDADAKAAAKLSKAAKTAAARAANKVAAKAAAKNQSNQSTMGTSTPVWQSSLHGAVDYNPPS